MWRHVGVTWIAGRVAGTILAPYHLRASVKVGGDPSVLLVGGRRTDMSRCTAGKEKDSVSGRKTMRIEIDDPAAADVHALLEEHLRNMHELSPPESVHALDPGQLKGHDITFWTARDGETLLGCGALKEIDALHAEVKSMRTAQAMRRQGVGRALLAHLLAVARSRGYKRLSLETGSMSAFLPARKLYESYGFTYCGLFADYTADPNSVFMTLEL